MYEVLNKLQPIMVVNIFLPWLMIIVRQHGLYFKPLNFKHFCAHVENQFNTSVKYIKTDHGSELINKSFQFFLSHFSISHQNSCTYTPLQNARVG